MKIGLKINKISKVFSNKMFYFKCSKIKFKMKKIDKSQVTKENSSSLKKTYTTIYLSDTFKRGIYTFAEINYIIYSSIKRKLEFHLVNFEIFEIRKNFSEIEKRLKEINIFYKLDRSTIININSIQILDYKKKQIIFKNKKCICTNRLKLKELENYYLKNYKQPLLVF